MCERKVEETVLEEFVSEIKNEFSTLEKQIPVQEKAASKVQMKSEYSDTEDCISISSDNTSFQLEFVTCDELHIKHEDEGNTADTTVQTFLEHQYFTPTVGGYQSLDQNHLPLDVSTPIVETPSMLENNVKAEGEQTYQCSKCGYNRVCNCMQQDVPSPATEKPFVENRLNQHSRIHTGEELFKCSVCDFKSADKGTVHILNHRGGNPYQCPLCNLKFCMKSDLQEHIRNHLREPFQCGICEFTFYQKSNLQLHILTHMRDKSLEGAVCDYKCSSESNLAKHIHTGEKLLKYHTCDFKCFESCALQKHSFINTNVKPFQCGMCDFRCKQKASLQRHIMLIHTGEKRFECAVCELKFSVESKLKRHIKKHDL